VNLRIALDLVVAAVASREDELVESMIRRNAAEVPDLGLARDEPVLAAVRASARANLRAGLAVLSDDAAPHGGAVLPVELPVEAVQEARESARARVPLEALLRTYRVGHAVAWEAFIEEVERSVPDAQGRQAVLRLLNRYAFAYIEAVLPVVASEYQAECRRLARQLEQRRFDAVLAVLDGTAQDAAELNYHLRGWNLGLIAWGGHPETAIAAIGRRLERPALCVKVGDRTAWGWFGGRATFGPESWQRMRRTRIPGGTSIAIGEGGAGVEGFRRTHRQAREAQRIGMALRSRFTRYSDVAVEALALRDHDAACQFVEQVLGPLGHARNAGKLRQTLAAYLRCGFNASATASSIGINDRTVAYRLKIIEGLIGRPLTSAWFELEAALRLERVLAGDDAGGLGQSPKTAR
jgi:hypothetical protein